MSSIVSEILASAKRGSICQLKDLHDCSGKLSSKCHDLKQTLFWDLKKEYAEFDLLHEPSCELVVQVMVFDEEMLILVSVILRS